MTPIRGNVWQIKNAISFPNAPRGTSEKLIYTVLEDLHHEQLQLKDEFYVQEPVTVTFGISAADEMEPVENLSGWKISLLAKFYSKVAYMAGLLRRSEFRVSRLFTSVCFSSWRLTVLFHIAQVRLDTQADVCMLPRKWLWARWHQCDAEVVEEIEN